MQRQFIRCQFRPGEGRAYTYHNDGERVEVGDKVHVDSRHGRATVHVCDVDVEEPREFETKPILGKHVEERHEEKHDAR